MSEPRPFRYKDLRKTPWKQGDVVKLRWRFRGWRAWNGEWDQRPATQEWEMQIGEVERDSLHVLDVSNGAWYEVKNRDIISITPVNVYSLRNSGR